MNKNLLNNTIDLNVNDIICDDLFVKGNINIPGGLASGNVNQGGNSFGQAMIIGTNDNQDFQLERNGLIAVTLDTLGLQLASGISIRTPINTNLNLNCGGGSAQINFQYGGVTTVAMGNGGLQLQSGRVLFSTDDLIIDAPSTKVISQRISGAEKFQVNNNGISVNGGSTITAYTEATGGTVIAGTNNNPSWNFSFTRIGNQVTVQWLSQTASAFQSAPFNNFQTGAVIPVAMRPSTTRGGSYWAQDGTGTQMLRVEIYSTGVMAYFCPNAGWNGANATIRPHAFTYLL